MSIAYGGATACARHPSCTPCSDRDSAKGAAPFRPEERKIPNAISPSATRMSSHGPKGDRANERSTPSTPLALPHHR